MTRRRPSPMTLLLDALPATQEQLARRLRCSQATVSDLAAGKGAGRELTLRIMARFRDVLDTIGVDAEDWLRGRVRQR